VLKKLGGDTARTADFNWSKGYFILYDVMLINKNRGEFGRWATAQGLASVGAEQQFLFE